MFGKSQEIADLQAALTVAIGERDSLATAALTHEAAINALTAERDAAVAQVATAQAAVAEAEKNAAARIAEFEAANRATIDAEVINRLASAGVDPIAREPEAGSSASNQLSQEEFNKLSPSKKSAFSIAGGRIV
jgi:phage shock protein A